MPMDKIHSAPTTERREMQAIGHLLDDMPQTIGRTQKVAQPILWVVLGLVVMMAFVGWLLVGLPPSQMAAPVQSPAYSGHAPSQN